MHVDKISLNPSLSQSLLKQRSLSCSPPSKSLRDKVPSLELPLSGRSQNSHAASSNGRKRRELPLRHNSHELGSKVDIEMETDRSFDRSLASNLTSGRQSSVLSETCLDETSLSGGHNRPVKSRVRKSVKAGQVSQRFPNQVLVSARSLQSQSFDLDTCGTFAAPSRSSPSPRALPQPKTQKVSF